LNDISIKKGSKIVQGIVRHVDLMNPIEIDNENYEKLANTERGEG
jgi:dUTPase